MSDNLPASTERHHKLFVKQSLGLEEFCTQALLIPVGHIFRTERVPDMDSYYIYVRSGFRFMVSGQELVQWEAVKEHPRCSPGRDEIIYDQG